MVSLGLLRDSVAKQIFPSRIERSSRSKRRRANNVESLIPTCFTDYSLAFPFLILYHLSFLFSFPSDAFYLGEIRTSAASASSQTRHKWNFTNNSSTYTEKERETLESIRDSVVSDYS